MQFFPTEVCVCNSILLIGDFYWPNNHHVLSNSYTCIISLYILAVMNFGLDQLFRGKSDIDSLDAEKRKK